MSSTRTTPSGGSHLWCNNNITPAIHMFQFLTKKTHHWDGFKRSMWHSSSFIHWLTWHKLQEIEYIMWFFRHISYSLAEGRTSINLIIHTRALLSRWQFLRLRRLLIHDIPLIPYPGSLLVTICAVKQLIIFHLHGAALFPPLTGAPWNTSYSRAYAPSTPSQHHHHHLKRLNPQQLLLSPDTALQLKCTRSWDGQIEPR